MRDDPARGEVLCVAVVAPPDRGRANAELCRLLADALGVDRRAVEVVGGSTSRDKTVAVRGAEAHEVARRLGPAVG